MTGISAVEIAQKQRYLNLLQKVKENETLSKVELDELSKYERKMTGKVILNGRKGSSIKRSKNPSTKRSTKPSTKRSTKQSKKAKKKRKARSPVDKAEVRRLGLECENLTEADAAISTRKSLKEIFREYPQIRKAWDRGRFLRNLRDLARTGVSISEASKKLGFANGRALRSMIDEDVEVGDLWNQTQLDVYIDIKSALIDAAKEGKADAVRAVESFLLKEKEQPEFDPSHVTTLQLTELTGKARQRIHEWHTKYGLPRNTDKTFDLSIFLAWNEEFLIGKASAEKGPAAVLDPLKQIKAERLKLELKKHRGEVLDREEVMAGLIARHQIVISWANHRAEELAWLCRGQKPERIVQLIKEAIAELRRDLCKIPEELRLPDITEKLFQKTLESLNDEKP